MGKKYCISKNIIINARPEQIFRVLADIENWNQWTPSVKRITIVNDIKFNKGTKARIVQPKLLPALWKITEIEKNKYFTWVTKYIGVKMTCKHIIESKNNITSVESVMIYEGIKIILQINIFIGFSIFDNGNKWLKKGMRESDKRKKI